VSTSTAWTKVSADMHICVSVFRRLNRKRIKPEHFLVRIFMPFELQIIPQLETLPEHHLKYLVVKTS
jgi:hypothetical protein